MPGQKIDAPDVSVDVLLQEILFEIRKDAVSIKSIVSGRESPAGNRGYCIDLIEHSVLPATVRIGMSRNPFRTP